jgi:protein-S-isoprenylcysteine O-methyltransferase Ste14
MVGGDAINLELRLPPVVLLVVCALAMLAVDRWLVGAAFVLPARWLAALVFCGSGVAIALLGVRAFARASTTVDPRYPERANTLVVAGVYRLTRNPMYLGMLLLLTGLALYLANAAALGIVLLFMSYMTRFQIMPEERAMHKRFGASYEAYRSAVRRWL